MRFHQNNLLALSATPSKPKIDYTKFVCNFNGDTQYIFKTSYNDQYCGVSWIEDVLLDGQPYQKDYATLYSTYNTLARAPGGGEASQIVDVGGSNFIHTIEIKFKEGFEFRNETLTRIPRPSEVLPGFNPTLNNFYLISIEFQDNITQICGLCLFQNCSQLEEINWNNVKLKYSLTHIFYECTNLKEIDFSTCIDRNDTNTRLGYYVNQQLKYPFRPNNFTKIIFPWGKEDASLPYKCWNDDYDDSDPNSLTGTFYYNEEGNYDSLLHYLPPTWTAVPMKFD